MENLKLIKNNGGRPKGSKDSRPRFSPRLKFELAATCRGLTPLDVMLETMHHIWDLSKKTSDPSAEIGLMLQAVGVAVQAAPYVHSKLATTTLRGEADNPLVLAQTTVAMNERKRPEDYLSEWLDRKTIDVAPLLPPDL